MATKAQANQARTLHADDLEKLGAHAIGVDSGTTYGKAGFVVVAFVAPGKDLALPTKLTVETTSKSIDVPLVVERTAISKAE